jgi:uncharacterized protein YdeI (YjbR/CyaY-like superfamily)
MPMKPRFFPTPSVFWQWLEQHHAAAGELLVGFHKTTSGKPSMTWPESVDAALCFGWIDGVRKRIDDVSYTIRFTPRRATSIWSAVNIRRVATLTKQGLMRPAGLKAVQGRMKHKSRIYAYEQRDQQLDPASEEIFRRNPAAWKFFQAQAPWYRKTVSWQIVSAKKAETKQRRLQKLIEASAQRRRIL